MTKLFHPRRDFEVVYLQIYTQSVSTVVRVLQADVYNYFGTVIISDGRWICEIRTRISMAKVALSKTKSVLANKKMAKAVRQRDY